jgi:ribosomal protein L7/L12
MQFYDYFQAYNNHFWNWQDDAEVVCLSDGSTIAYRGFLVEALDVLSEKGLPSFGSLLLAIAATNNGLTDVVDVLAQANKVVDISEQGEIYKEATSFLKILQKLPIEYKQGPRRLQVLQVLFEDCHNRLGIKPSRNIAAVLKHFTADLAKKMAQIASYNPYQQDVLLKDLRVIALMHRRFGGTVDIINAVAGLPPIDDDIRIEPPQSEAMEPPLAKDFVTELLADPKTFSVGALIPRIWSGLQIPFHHTVPSQQPLGGVSDLSNKGDLDRLLISEFANDDLVLMSRLANNEALYLQREIPPSNNDEERILLVDVSIRNWGTPKLMAFAAALAIAKHPKTDIPCRIFCVGNNCVPAAIDTMPQLIDSLMEVSEGLHAASGLELFFNLHADKKKQELFFISHPTAMAYPAVQKVISDHYTWFKYWVTVEQDGRIELYRNQHNSKKFIQQIQLPLEELWAQKPPASQPATDVDIEWPAHYPLLFPRSNRVKQFLYSPDENRFFIDNEGAVLQYVGNVRQLHPKGMQMVLPKIPGGHQDEFAIGKGTDEQYKLLCFNRQKREVTILCLGTQQSYTTPFAEGLQRHHSAQFFFYKNSFFLFSYGDVYRLSHTSVPFVKKYDGISHELRGAHQHIVDEQKNMASQATDYGSFLKNVHSVSVSSTGHLLLGKHQLAINSQVIKWKLGNTLSHLSAAKAEARIPGQLFVFPCGSTVQVNRSGMLLLRSGAPQGFGQYDVLLEERGESPISVIKAIRENIDYSLVKGKELVEGCPAPLGLSVDQSEAQRIVDKLHAVGARAKLIPTEGERVIYLPLVLDKSLGVATNHCFAGNSLYHIDTGSDALPVIPTDQFYNNKIKPFIQYILDHGT